MEEYRAEYAPMELTPQDVDTIEAGFLRNNQVATDIQRLAVRLQGDSLDRCFAVYAQKVDGEPRYDAVEISQDRAVPYIITADKTGLVTIMQSESQTELAKVDNKKYAFLIPIVKGMIKEAEYKRYTENMIR